MLPVRRVLQVAAPATLLGIFGVWFAVTPPSGRSRDAAARRGFEGSLMRESHRTRPVYGPANAAARRVLETAVNRHLNALNKGDYQTALRFAAVSFRERFTPRGFGELVRREFPEMRTVKKATFGQARHTDESADMAVSLQGHDNSRTEYFYHFVREGREWRISGVSPRRPPRPSPPATARVARPDTQPIPR